MGHCESLTSSPERAARHVNEVSAVPQVAVECKIYNQRESGMTIVASMLWRRLDSPGHDACSLERHSAGWNLQGVATFRHRSGPARIIYSVQCDREWQTVSGQVRGVLGKHSIDFVVTRHRTAWMLNGSVVPNLGHLIDLDFNFTPATNLQQLRRVSMGINESVLLPVAWFNVDVGTLTELPQVYERRGDNVFSYSAPSVGYEGMLELSPNGFIRHYPNLWEAESELM